MNPFTFDSLIELDFIADFGGNLDGITSNVEAFASFNEYVRIRRKNTKLTIPAGAYLVGKQTINGYGYEIRNPFYSDPYRPLSKCRRAG
ncbi:hypothetical protein [Pedobacter panaciterrae]|uniref:hypothetical protein n=1 Tax=Pedobacter panaciterrae TaxID=363849 RepID=UPI002594720A|nr:hypothetical protein [uncultured Pedobacter sp.]